MAITTDQKIEMHELLSRLYAALDSHDAEGFASFFTPDGEFDAYALFKGRKAIADFLKEHIRKGNEDNARHIISNLIVEEVGGAPVIRSYISKLRIQPQVALVAYADLQANIVKDGSGWKMSRLKLAITLSPS
jgi:ketosteroid isomerase-like protein